MIKIAEEQAVHAEVLGATSSLVDNGIIHIADVEELDNFVKIASDVMLEAGYETPEELATGIIEIYKKATDATEEMEGDPMEPEDYDEDEEDAEDDKIARVLKEASDIDEAYNLCVDLVNAGHISTDMMDKVANAYDSGELKELLYQTKLEKIANAKLDAVKSLAKRVGGSTKDKVKGAYTKIKGAAGTGKDKLKSAVGTGKAKWNGLSKKKKIGIAAGAGVGAAGAAGGVGYGIYKKKNQA